MSWVRVPSDTQAERSFKKRNFALLFISPKHLHGAAARTSQTQKQVFSHPQRLVPNFGYAQVSGGSDKPNAKTSFFVWLVSRLVVTLHLQTIYCEKNTFFALCPGCGDSSDVPADKRSNRLAASESADVCSRKRVLLFLRAHRYSHSRPPHKRRCGVQLWDVRLEEASLRVELHHGAY